MPKIRRLVFAFVILLFLTTESESIVNTLKKHNPSVEVTPLSANADISPSQGRRVHSISPLPPLLRGGAERSEAEGLSFTRGGVSRSEAEGLNIEGFDYITKIDALPHATWQKSAKFPDWLGRVDDTLALNSMLSFHFWHAQGEIYLDVSKNVKTFDMFINSRKVDTKLITPPGIYAVDISDYAVDGINTLQVSNINAGTVSVFIPYPVILEGTLEDSGIRPEAVQFISDIIESDIKHGFTTAQLAIVRNGRLVYSNAWGEGVDTLTLYDLASVTKMFSVNYAVQKLVTDGKLDLDTRVSEIFGHAPADITVRDVLCHRAGYPPEVPYHDSRISLYSGADGSPKTRAKTLQSILKTPLIYKPRTRILYSDVDYMLACFIVEKITGKRLDDYMSENFWLPLELKRITFNPLQNNFSSSDCAPTEIHGNTREGNMTFKGIRTYTLRGEVHDQKAFHSMGGISGHAGLFSNAEDLAKLASIMFNGGYGGHRFFSRNIIDFFTSPQNYSSAQWATGWWREGDDQRVWYFGTQSPSSAFGHQGWTGTLVMIDPSRNLVIVYLTNKINSPVVRPYTGKKIFSGNWYTASTLGFVPQIILTGIDQPFDVSEQLSSLLCDMVKGSEKLIPEGAGKNHPSVLNARSKKELCRSRADSQ